MTKQENRRAEIYELQTMLRLLSQINPNFPPVNPDGIYGPETVSAVSAFQRFHGLPVTGVTDNSTWETIVDIYEDYYRRMRKGWANSCRKAL